MLERRPRAGGRTLVDHPNKQYDHANSLAISAAFAKKATVVIGYPIGVGHVPKLDDNNPLDADGDRYYVGSLPVV